jgi:thioredoxin-related protein/YHS domain-containing protein
MTKTLGLLCLAIAAMLQPSVGLSQQQAIQWEPSLDNAQRLASQTNRLVLIYFCGPSCVYCRRMEAEVLSRPSVAASVNADFVAVKVVADHYPATARRYGITNLPTTVITTPQGQVLDSRPGFIRAEDYAARIAQVAADARRRNQTVVAQIQGGPSPQAADQAAGQSVAGQLAANALMQGQPGVTQANPNQLPPYQQVASPTASPAVDRPIVNQPATVQVPPPGQPPFVNMGVTNTPPPVNIPPLSPPTAVQTAPPGQPSIGVINPNSPSPNGVAPVPVPPNTYEPSQRPIPGPSISSVQPSPTLVQPPATANYALMPQQPAAGQPPTTITPPQNNVAPQPALHNPAFGLDGFCPVSLAEKQQWVRGDTRWGVNHRGRTYLFAGPEEQRRFFTDPDRYAPVALGNDIVLAAEQGQAVPGTREHGVFFGNRVYLFSSEASLDKFARNPNAYANRALEALRGGANPPRQQWR